MIDEPSPWAPVSEWQAYVATLTALAREHEAARDMLQDARLGLEQARKREAA